MKQQHVISDELLQEAQGAFAIDECWVAYNTALYFLDRGDMHFFKDRAEAQELGENNISEYDHYKIIYARSVDELLKQIPYGEIMKLSKLNLTIMNEKNFEYLKDNIKYQGFGETLYGDLENQLKKGESEFNLGFKTQLNKTDIEATLHFKKSDSTDMYFFNKYAIRVSNEKKDETMAQTFYMNKGQGITLKEAYNLLNGRAVHKELTDKQDQKYQAWVQLDFGVKDKNGNYERKQFHQNYGYDIKEALSYYPIKEMMKEEEKEKLVRSLEKGNLQMVTLETPAKDIKVFIEASPQFKSVNLYDSSLKRLDQQQRQELMQSPQMKDKLKQDVKKSASQEVGEESIKKKTTRKKKGLSI